MGPTGDLFVGDFANSNILRYTSAGTFIGVFSNDPAVDTPFDVVFGTGGDLFVGSGGATANVARLNGTTGAVVSASFTSGNAIPIGAPHYLEFGPALALSDLNGHVAKFNSTTGVNTAFTALDNPQGLAYNAAGDLYIAQRISNNVVILFAGGGPSQEVIPTGTFSGGVPADVEFGPNGLLYVSTGSAIYRFDTSGATPTLVDSFGRGGQYMVFTDAVPEPSTLAQTGTLLLMGGWFAYRRRTRKSK